MKRFRILLLVLFAGVSAFGQIIKKDSVEVDIDEKEADSIMETVLLEEVVIRKGKQLTYAQQKEFLILQNRVYKVYPYAKVASERLLQLDRNMAKLKTKKEKKKYFKIVEDYIENEFTDKLKKLSRKQGQILVKLIHRQTGRSTYSIIKDYKSGWKAFWSSNTAKVFDIDLKRGYFPEEVNEDYLIETILQRAFESGRLVEQKAANPVDIEELNAIWEKKAAEQAKVEVKE